MRRRTIITTSIILLATPYLLLPSHAATLLFYPQNVSILEGQTEIVEVRLDTEGETINAVEISGLVNTPNATIDSVETTNSFLQFFAEQPIAKGDSFRIVGGLPNGFEGEGIAGILILKGENPGNAKLTFDPSSVVLVHSEETKQLPLAFKTADISVSEKGEGFIELTSRSHPNETQWYNNRNINIHWELEDGVGYSYLVSRLASEAPDDIPDRPTGELEWMGDISININEDGIYYFAVKRVGENKVSRYRTLIDTTPPEWVSVELSAGVPETDGDPFLSFLARDTLAGIDRYEIQVDGKAIERVSSPYVIPFEYRTVLITAYDKAGNKTEYFIKAKVSKEGIFTGLFTVLLLALLGIIWREIQKKSRKKKQKKE